MILTIASGKGGTGKTTVAVNLAYALARRGETVRLLDADVEEPNDHLFVRPEFAGSAEVTVPKPVWDEAKCTGCGACAKACNYNALAVVKGKVLVFNELCHSCGVCAQVCPEGAFTERETAIGAVRTAPATSAGGAPFLFAQGLLNIGEALAPNVVRGVKEHVAPEAVNIIDASPGTACPVVEAVEGSDAVLLVTEPTPFGLNDLKLAVGLVLKIGVPTGIIINRSDGDDRIITDYAEAVGLPIAGRIPFRRAYAETYSAGGLLVDEFPEVRDRLLNIFDRMDVALPPTPPEDVLRIAQLGTQASFTTGSAKTHREITVISGKGGTGKTTVTAALAQLAEGQILADNDVDAADLHLLLKPVVREEHDFVGGITAVIEADSCIGCGKCADACHFDALRFDGPANDVVGQTYRIEPLLCEGCGLCPLVCPTNAIRTVDQVNGRWYVSGTDFGPMVHARLGIAEENSGRLVTQVRNRAAQLADELRRGLVLGDGPPGTGCPVIASVSGTDLVVVVTEPTLSGVHDLERVLNLAAHFGVPTSVVINKSDLNAEQTRRIERIAERAGSPVLGKIPFDRQVNDALMAGQTIIEYDDGDAATAVRTVWENLRAIADMEE